MRPERGALVCIRCTRSGRARTVLSQGKSIRLQQGQQGLTGVVAAPASPGASDAPLQPRRSDWVPHEDQGAGPHPQLGLFPHDAIRDGQKRFTRDIIMTLAGGRHLVAQAPTGIGKTAAALAPALQHALEQQRTVLFLTSRQSQHKIAVDTLRLIRERRGARFTLVDLVSKRDMCLRDEAVELHPARFPDFCARETRLAKSGKGGCRFIRDLDDDTLRQVRAGVLHVEELMQTGKESQLCPHLLATTAAAEAHVVVADYNH